jgi:cytochrome bd ubiquinol oxidase subunit II
VFLPAFYIPVLLLLFGLIFRGVAFEFRHRAPRRLWDRGFFSGQPSRPSFRAPQSGR